MSDPLRDVDVPIAHTLPVEPDGLASRLYGTPALHRAVPGPLAVALAMGRGELEWRLLRKRRAMAERHAAVVAPPGTSPDAVRRLARAHLRELCVQTELSWRPWAARRMRIEGLEHLRRARAEGRGAILAGAHMGPMLNLHAALAARGERLYLSGGRHPAEPVLRGHEGRWVKTQNVWIEEAGHRWVRRGGSAAAIGGLLDRGEVVWMAADANGSRRVMLLGREARVGSGLARLARDQGVPVVPAVCVRERGHQVARLGAALCPSAFASDDALGQAIIDAVGAELAAHLPQAHACLALRFSARPATRGAQHETPAAEPA